MIKEVIVVEGKDDIAAVKNALEAELIATNGFGYKEEFIENLQRISKRRGVIILMDPDHAGERIRRDISQRISGCKHAFISQGKVLKDGDVGVENASKEDIIAAISRARPIVIEERREFTKIDLIELGFIGSSNSRYKRERIGQILGIGYANSKQFVNRLNNFGISREEFFSALKGMKEYD